MFHGGIAWEAGFHPENVYQCLILYSAECWVPILLIQTQDKENPTHVKSHVSVMSL